AHKKDVVCDLAAPGNGDPRGPAREDLRSIFPDRDDGDPRHPGDGPRPSDRAPDRSALRRRGMGDQRVGSGRRPSRAAAASRGDRARPDRRMTTLEPDDPRLRHEASNRATRLATAGLAAVVLCLAAVSIFAAYTMQTQVGRAKHD